MANIYVSSSGSSTSPYDTWAKAATSPQTAINLAGGSADNIVIFDDETWDLSSGLSFSVLANSFTCQSRSADPTLCIWTRSSATGNLLGFGGMANAITVTLKNIGITRSATMTGAGGGAICWYSSGTADANITFDGCKIHDITMNTTINALTTGAIVRTSAATVLSTITFTDCIFSNLNITSTSCASIISARNNINVVVTRPTITNHTAIQTGVHAGLFYLVDGDLTVTDPVVSGVTLTGTAGSANTMNGVFFTVAGTLTISGASVSNIVSSGHTPHGLFARANGPFTVSDITVHDCSMSACGDDSLGLAFLAYNGSSGTYNNSEVYNCTAQNGAGFYGNGDATITVNGLHSHDNIGIPSNAGVFSAGAGLYLGGSGDVTLNGCVLTDNTAGSGAGLFIQRHGSIDAGVDKTVTINNCTVANNTSTSDGNDVEPDEGTVLKSYNAADELFVDFTNCILRDSDTNNVWLAGNAGTAGITVTFDYTNLQNDQVGVGVNVNITTESLTYTNEITTDPALDSSYVPTAAIGAGTKWWGSAANPVGADGELFTDLATDIGGIQSTLDPFHPVNL